MANNKLHRTKGLEIESLEMLWLDHNKIDYFIEVEYLGWACKTDKIEGEEKEMKIENIEFTYKNANSKVNVTEEWVLVDKPSQIIHNLEWLSV